MKMRRLLLCLVVAFSSVASASTFNLFEPATGVLVGSSASYVTSAASHVDITNLWSGTCNSTTFLRGDGSCVATATGTVTSVGLVMPSGFSVAGTPITTSGAFSVTTALSGLLKGTGTGFTTAAASDVTSLWSGTCDASTFLRGDGACVAAGGSFPLLAPDGSSSAPSYSFSSSTSSGLYNDLGYAGPVLKGANVTLLTDLSGSVQMVEGSTSFFSGNSSGLVIGSAVGGQQGAGTINATGLYVDGVAVGGGGTPGGSNTQLQYNNAGAFGGTAGITYDSANQSLGLNSTVTNLLLKLGGSGGVSSPYFAFYDTSGTRQGLVQSDALSSRFSIGTDSYGFVVNTGASDRFQISNSGQITFPNNLTFTLPSGATLAGSTILTPTSALNASNISSGTVGSAYGGAGAVSGIMKANGSGTVSAAASSDVTATFSGTCNSSTYLRGDGSCATPSTSGTDGASVVASGSTSCGDGSFCAVAYASEDFDTGSYHDNATNNSRITLPTSTGYFQCTASVTLSETSGTPASGYADFTLLIALDGNNSSNTIAVSKDEFYSPTAGSTKYAALTVTSPVLSVGAFSYAQAYFGGSGFSVSTVAGVNSGSSAATNRFECHAVK